MDAVLGNIILIVIIVAFVGGALFYMFHNRKKGLKCIGCPYAKSCGGGCHNSGISAKSGTSAGSATASDSPEKKQS